MIVASTSGGDDDVRTISIRGWFWAGAGWADISVVAVGLVLGVGGATGQYGGLHIDFPFLALAFLAACTYLAIGLAVLIRLAFAAVQRSRPPSWVIRLPFACFISIALWVGGLMANHTLMERSEPRGDALVAKVQAFRARHGHVPEDVDELRADGVTYDEPLIPGRHFGVAPGWLDADDFEVSFSPDGWYRCFRTASNPRWGCTD